ncbi:MAG: hypothetical protein H8E76_07920 [Helicobacteraceae bacterium]|nr:hypothetical protein [Candidatus Sulfurimonas ponti]MBL6973590.1 hypothetical protein [Sulfurimonas sp.]
MGLAIIAIVFGLYIFVFIKSFYFTKSSEIVSISYFETLKLNARIILVISLLILAIALIIHGGVYWGLALFSASFSFLGFITPTSLDDRMEVYLEQVALIIFTILMPYAKYSWNITKEFKTKLFTHYLEKYNLNIDIISNKLFPAIHNIVFTNKTFLHKVQDNLSNPNIKNSSRSNIDDTFYFPDKNIYITESNVEIIEEVYKIDDKGKGKWKVTNVETVFNGLVIILPKEDYHPSSTISQVSIFSVVNSSAVISSNASRSDKKHGFILDLYYNYFRGAKKHTYSKNNFSEKNFNSFNTEYEDYQAQNQELYAIAQKMNISYIMEDNKYVYLFHNEKNIDLFTFYQNEDVTVSLQTFEDDLNVLLNISEEFHLKNVEDAITGI